MTGRPVDVAPAHRIAAARYYHGTSTYTYLVRCTCGERFVAHGPGCRLAAMDACAEHVLEESVKSEQNPRRNA